jgi:hypothetical protein
LMPKEKAQSSQQTDSLFSSPFSFTIFNLMTNVFLSLFLLSSLSLLFLCYNPCTTTLFLSVQIPTCLALSCPTLPSLPQLFFFWTSSKAELGLLSLQISPSTFPTWGSPLQGSVYACGPPVYTSNSILYNFERLTNHRYLLLLPTTVYLFQKFLRGNERFKNLKLVFHGLCQYSSNCDEGSVLFQFQACKTDSCIQWKIIYRKIKFKKI